jgi:hypothetical protein
MGYAGYAYRNDDARFKATPGNGSDPNSGLAQEGDMNSVSISGHYVNLVLEMGF